MWKASRTIPFPGQDDSPPTQQRKQSLLFWMQEALKRDYKFGSEYLCEPQSWHNDEIQSARRQCLLPPLTSCDNRQTQHTYGPRASQQAHTSDSTFTESLPTRVKPHPLVVVCSTWSWEGNCNLPVSVPSACPCWDPHTGAQNTILVERERR